MPLKRFAVTTLATAVLIGGCLDAAPPNGAFQCGTGERPCPAGYYCAPQDGRCWKEGEPSCFATDMAVCPDGGDMCTNVTPCWPGQTRTVPCGNCGTQIDTCNDMCQWTLGTCEGQGVCKPSTTRKVACGKCGTETDTCASNCQWTLGACTGQGVCTPGATQAGSCNKCSQQTCTSSCTWSSCALKPGNACETGESDSWRPCNTCSSCSGEQRQYCLPECQWSTGCTCCVTTGCDPSKC